MIIERYVDELTKEQWGIVFIDMRLYLDSYYLLKRDSTRHKKYHSEKKYERLSGRDSTIKEQEVPFPCNVKQEALDRFTNSIKVMKWGERKS